MEMEKEVLILNLDDVLPNRFQPRIKFNEKNILELAESIREHGVIQPIVVRKIADKYEIIAGERRYKASVLAGKTTIPAIVTNLDDKNSAEIALIENVQRQDLTPIEEAISYKKILDMGYISQASLAEKLGKTQSTVANKLRLLNLDDEVQEALLEEKISERHARSLLKLEKKDQVEMLNRILKERMTVRKTDEEIMKLFSRKKKENEVQSPAENIQTVPTEPVVPTSPVSPVQPEGTPIMPAVEPQPIVPNVQPVAEAVKEPIPEIYNVTNENNGMNGQVNPGFMDIDKIANEAQDLFPKPEVQPMKEVPNVESQSIVPNVQPEGTPIMPTVEPQPIVPNVQPVVEPQPVVPNVQPVVEPVVPTPVPSETEGEESGAKPTVGRFFNMMNMNREEETNPNYVSDLEEKEVNMDFNKPVDTAPIFQFNPIPPAEKKEEVQPVVNPVVEEVIQPNISEPVKEEVPTNFITQPNFANPTPVVSAVESSEPAPFEPFKPYTLTDDSEFTSPVVAPAEIPIPREQQFVSTINTNEIQPVMKVEEEEVKTIDLKNVIQTIRDCVKTIEEYGYKVDEEEVDLQNSYQVTITIDK